MSHKTKRLVILFTSGVMIIFSMAFVSACTSQETPEPQSEQNMDSNMGDMDSDPSVNHIPNDGAVIRILSPEDGATFANGEDIKIKIEIENFKLNNEGSHWHVYVNGVSYGMVVGESYTEVLRGIEPGKHKVAAYLANGAHEELEDGAIIHITVTE
ncbi:MAG: hypothetical protein ACE5GO_08250 [Anaerolineales bacterium]